MSIKNINKFLSIIYLSNFIRIWQCSAALGRIVKQLKMLSSGLLLSGLCVYLLVLVLYAHYTYLWRAL